MPTAPPGGLAARTLTLVAPLSAVARVRTVRAVGAVVLLTEPAREGQLHDEDEHDSYNNQSSNADDCLEVGRHHDQPDDEDHQV